MKDIKSVFNDVNEYYEFARRHKVYGAKAVELKKQMDKSIDIGYPKIGEKK